MLTDEKSTGAPPASVVAGKSAAGGGADAAIDRLRAKRAAGVPGAEPRGRGRPPLAKPAQPPAPVQDRDSLNKKMGLAWRGVGMALCLGTGTNAFSLAPEEEKLMGESYGDVCAELGIVDSTAVKVVFLVGTTLGVFGPKAVSYASYRADLARRAALVKKGQDAKPEQPARQEAAAQPEPVRMELPPGMHETPRGSL